ncbi:putative cytochrome p450 protein [Botrytis fragariae]|uniref:Putative cytochrome p450 protein n=1 Tax=Botrytis fragariae TaxID=1964551 RepID=A0A8H6AMJ0_9HELO|nr:putative cytochrome p450 protein [Botrytis fragariae]KAF5870207.1 putative cytochrome p450 protein [Botrytis fragariae]
MVGALEIRTSVEVLINIDFADLVSNPGLYKANSASVNLQKSFNATYRAVTSDTLSNDTTIFQSLNISNQPIGVLPSTSSTTSTSIYSHNGIVEFGDSSLSVCRFRLVLSTNSICSLPLGAFKTDLVNETSLRKVPIIWDWATFGDITINSSISTILQDITLEFDSANTGVVGFMSAEDALFNLTNIQSVLIFYAAGDALPSKLNFTSSAASKKSPVFEIESSALSIGQNGESCIFVISGFDYEAQPGLWVMGQAFSQEKYLDHDLDNGLRVSQCLTLRVKKRKIGAVYRLYFYPLRHISGPKIAALTWWYEFYSNVTKPGQYVFHIKKLHEEYGLIIANSIVLGPIIRITPDEIHLQVPGSFGATVSFDVHKKRREALVPFFSKRNVLYLESMITSKVQQLCDVISSHAVDKLPLNLSDVLFAFSNDMAENFLFAHEVNNLADEKNAASLRRNTYQL